MEVLVPIGSEILKDKNIKIKLILYGLYWGFLDKEEEQIILNKKDFNMNKMASMGCFGVRQTIAKDKNYLIEKGIWKIDNDKILMNKSENYFVKIDDERIPFLLENCQEEEIKLYLFLKNKRDYYGEGKFEFSIWNLVSMMGWEWKGQLGKRVEEWLNHLKSEKIIDFEIGRRIRLIDVK